MTSPARRSRALLALGALLAALAAAPPAGAQEGLPPLEDLLENATSAQDSAAIREAYMAAVSLQQAAPPRETEREAPPGPERRGAVADTTGEVGDRGAPAGVAIPQEDSVYRRLAGTPDTTAPGQGPIQYHGQRLVFFPQGEVIVLEGEARARQGATELEARRILYRSREGLVEAFQEGCVVRGESKLCADSLFYDRETGTVATFGASVLAEGQTETRGVDLKYDLERKSGRLGGGVTTYDPWILEGASMAKIGASTFTLAEGWFTTCDLEDPHYTFRADEIKLRQNDVIVAKPVVLYFSDIPVLFLPWYVEPVARGRRTGFLRPKIGLNSLIFGSGKERNVQDIGYYYIWGDYADATAAADWYTESRFILRGDLRYHVRHEFRGGVHVEQVWNRLDESSSRLVRYNHDHTFSRRTRAGVDVNWSNTRQFLKRNSFDSDEILQRSFRSAANYSMRFDWGSFVAGSSADFHLDRNRTDFSLPDVRVSINQRPLWGAARRSAPGAGGAEVRDDPWYRRLQYSANASFASRLSRAAVDSLGNPLSRIPVDSLGRPIDVDEETVVNQQETRGGFTLNGPMNLFGVIHTTPSLTYNVSVNRDHLAEDEKIGGQGQLNAGLSLNTRFFRIFRSMPGPWFTAMRHTVAPTVALSYSPQPTFFGAAARDDRLVGRESFFANFSLSNDFEVKMPVRREKEEAVTEDAEAPVEEAVEEAAEEAPGEAVEEAPAEAAPEEEEEAGEVEETPEDVAPDAAAPDPDDRPAGGPRVREEEVETRTVQLLSVVNSFNLDILEQAEEGRIGLSDLSTRLTSGIGRDFNISMTLNHQLVERGVEEGEADELSPFLNRITTDFSIRRGGVVSVGRRRGVLEGQGRVAAGRGDEESTEDARETLAAESAPGVEEGFGPWSLNLTHSWTRNRGGQGNRQSVGIATQFLPTSNWSLRYRTDYDVTEGQLQAQTLSLVRDLHDWQATLSVNIFPSEPQDRVLIAFSVFLRDVPDLQVPYRVRRE